MAKRKKRSTSQEAKRGTAPGKSKRRQAATPMAAWKAKKAVKKIGRKATKRVPRVVAKASGRGEAWTAEMPTGVALIDVIDDVSSAGTPIETAVIEVVEEPAPGVVVVSEFEAVRVTVPDDHKTKG